MKYEEFRNKIDDEEIADIAAGSKKNKQKMICSLVKNFYDIPKIEVPPPLPTPVSSE